QMSRTLISQEELQRTLRSVAGKVLFFLDTCHAGAVMPGDARRGVADMSRLVAELSAADNGVVVFAAATGRQESQESSRWENGAFTRALVEGLRGQAAYQHGRPITVSMLEVYISERVKELTGGTQTPTTAKPGSLPDFPIAVGVRSAPLPVASV